MNLSEAPCKTTLDLNEFRKFDAADLTTSRDRCIIRVRHNKVSISAAIGKTYKDDDKVTLLINKKGNIIVLQKDLSETGTGLKIKRQNPKNSQSKFIICKALINYIENLGLKLPAEFQAKYDEELQAWVGRLARKQEESSSTKTQ